MKHIDLTEFTLFLLAIAVLVPIQIKASTPKKTWQIRGIIIAAVLLLYAIVVGINLRPVPSNGDTTVYITSTGNKYHSESCRHLSKSKIETTLAEAITDGYGDCAHCNTPDYNSETITPKFSELYSKNGLQTTGIVIAVCVVFYGSVFIGIYILDRKKEHELTLAKAASNRNIIAISKYMWEIVVRFSKSTSFANDTIFNSYIWTTLYYSIIDVIERQHIPYRLSEYMVSTMPLDLINSTPTAVNHIVEYSHQTILKVLQSEKLNLNHHSDIRKALDLIYCYSVPEDTNPENIPTADSKDVKAFYNTMLLLKTYISGIYPNEVIQ